MAQNLNIGTRIDGTTGQTNNSIIEKYCYDDLESNCDIYGGLYQWNEYMNYTTSSSSNPSGRQGICPDGWHIPSDPEWEILTTFLGGLSVAGGKMKSTGTIMEGNGLWNEPNAGATNESGFTAHPGGLRDSGGSFYTMGDIAFFWSATEATSTFAGNLYADTNNDNAYENTEEKTYGFSARCVKD